MQQQIQIVLTSGRPWFPQYAIDDVLFTDGCLTTGNYCYLNYFAMPLVAVETCKYFLILLYKAIFLADHSLH